MVVTGLDTHELVKQLTAAGFTDPQAEALTAALRKAQDIDLSNLATKTDLAALSVATKADLAALALATKADLAALSVATKADLAALASATKTDLAETNTNPPKD